MLEPCRAEERKVEKSKVEGKERGQALETGEPRPPPWGSVLLGRVGDHKQRLGSDTPGFKLRFCPSLAE